MKRLFCVLALSFVLISSVFAYSFNCSLLTGYSYESMEVSEYEWKSSTIPLSLELSFYFDDSFGFVVGSEFLTFPINGSFYDLPADMKISAYFFPYLAFSYKADFTEDLSLSLALGTRFASRVLYATNRIMNIDMYADLALRYEVIDSLLLQCGVRGYIPVFSHFSMSQADDYKAFPKGFDVMPYIGIGYFYSI